MLKNFLLLIALILAGINQACASEGRVTLGDWTFIGDGFTASVDDAVLVSEYPGSKGVMLVSPRSYSPLS